ncbi:oxygen-dependent protoporphyrinogen oxidase [Propionicimonas paludicola]|uniref:Coproporphyrinogen III oxidase n=1 Tax=Propionicimonas paludicola TaxID=185243 RepID=A0A2A9CUT5_9ACTN|nr:protoporphyrinogen oxidase [Propionicimonas paludicola]PFG17906.1 oxygen-dependent protoporphyrinogen oxidase [Propionicimonas paludicola]
MKLLVVGGGIAGLAAAWEAIARPGTEVVLVEADDRLGGKLHTESVDGFLIEHGPDSFVSYRPAAAQLAREVGLGDELIGTSGTRQVYLRSRDKLRPIPAGMGMVLPTRLLPFATTGILSVGAKLRAGLDLVLPRQLGTDDVAIGAFLRRRLGGGIVTGFADPMVGGIYGASVDELSLDAVLPSLRSDEAAHRSLILASLASGRKARAARRASGARGPGSPFQTLRGGLGTLVDSVADRLTAAGAEVRTGVSVRSLTRTEGGGAHAELSDGTVIEADAVVLAGGVRSSAELLAEVAPSAAAALADVPLATSNVINLGYRASAFPAPVTTHGWLEAQAAPISGVTVSSAKWAGRAGGDQVLIRAFVPERLGPIATADTDELLATVIAHVGTVLGATGAPFLTRLTRWTSVMPKYTVGHLDRIATAEAALAELPSWRIAGSALRGVGVPDCIADGRRQAAAALDAATTPEATPARETAARVRVDS